jgi:catechol 2,3-dioxygenase-like lactoylglutathione lyase family enzyme
MNFTHIRVLVTDFARSFRFYADELGLPVEEGDPDGVYASFTTPSAHISIYPRSWMAAAVGAPDMEPDTPAPDAALLALAVESVDDAFERLRGRGVAFLNEPHDRPDWGIRVLHLRDPDGLLIELNEPLPTEKWSPELRAGSGLDPQE